MKTTGGNFHSAIVTALTDRANWVNKLHCYFTKHDDRHTERNRDNHLRQLVPATKTCNRCGRFWSEKL